MKTMNIINQKKIVTVLSFAVLVIPMVTYGAGLVPDCGANCGFSDLIAMTNRIIKFLVIDVSVPLASLGFMVAGAKLVLNQNKEGAWSEAKQSFGTIAMGFGIILAAFLLIKLVLSAFLGVGYTTYLLE